ncbi:MAG: RNA polymerase sigma factor [Cyclobacteriaceae bacterium]|nr:RNA polymerase sigma factor [Cyclobacteriaceae bacterium]
MTDEQLMEAVKNGDLSKASLLFERYHVRIYNFLLRMTAHREMAEDLAQNVFVRLLRYRNTYKPELPFKAWIYQLARHAFSDYYQQAKKQRWVPLASATEMKDELQQALEQEELERKLISALARLDDDARELLVLTRFQHLKYDEVAAQLGLTVANVKVKVHRAIGHLRNLYFQLETQA